MRVFACAGGWGEVCAFVGWREGVCVHVCVGGSVCVCGGVCTCARVCVCVVCVLGERSNLVWCTTNHPYLFQVRG